MELLIKSITIPMENSSRRKVSRIPKTSCPLIMFERTSRRNFPIIIAIEEKNQNVQKITMIRIRRKFPRIQTP